MGKSKGIGTTMQGMAPHHLRSKLYVQSSPWIAIVTRFTSGGSPQCCFNQRLVGFSILGSLPISDLLPTAKVAGIRATMAGSNVCLSMPRVTMPTHP